MSFFVAVLLLGFAACSENDISVAGITLNHSTLELLIGETETKTLIVSINPGNATNQDVRWSNSNPAVATQEFGLITAVSVGTTTITVTTFDGGKTASAEVTVRLSSNQIDEGVVINGVRWATRNVDAPGRFAANPEDTGMFYRWGRRVGWSSTDPIINSNGGRNWSNPFDEHWYRTWEKENDPCPTGWRVPTVAELHSLNSAGSIPVANWNDTGVILNRYQLEPYGGI